MYLVLLELAAEEAKKMSGQESKVISSSEQSICQPISKVLTELKVHLKNSHHQACTRDVSMAVHKSLGRILAVSYLSFQFPRKRICFTVTFHDKHSVVAKGHMTLRRLARLQRALFDSQFDYQWPMV